MQQVPDFGCPLCLMICVDPILLEECNHMLCSACMMDLQDYNTQQFKCPLCRKSYINNKSLVVNFELANKIEQSDPKLYAERKKQIRLQQLLLPNQIKVKVNYGNTYKKIQSLSRNKHLWTVFVGLNYNKDTDRAALKEFSLNQMIESVTFTLHQTFKPNVYTIKEQPFILQKVGWGIFDIPITIKFKTEYNIPNLELVHYLCFIGEGLTQNSVTKINISQVQQFKELQLQQSLEKQVQQELQDQQVKREELDQQKKSSY